MLCPAGKAEPPLHHLSLAPGTAAPHPSRTAISAPSPAEQTVALGPKGLCEAVQREHSVETPRGAK